MKFKTKTEQIKYLEKELKKYKRLSHRDTLTGLFNRRQLEIDLKRYLEIKKRHNIPFLFVMLDIDNFKRINDIQGHKVGDKVLKKVANLIKQTIRKIDKVYRLSGDEYIIIFSHYKKYTKMIKRIRTILSQNDIQVSIGYNKICKNILEIIDKKMYEDKHKR